MPINNRIAGLADEITGWRRHLHEMPELLYDVHQTAACVATSSRHSRAGSGSWFAPSTGM